MDQIEKLKQGTKEDWIEAIMSVRHLAPLFHAVAPEYSYRKDPMGVMRRPPGLQHPMMPPMPHPPYPREMMPHPRGVPAEHYYPPYAYRYPPTADGWGMRPHAHHMPRRPYRNEMWSDPLKPPQHQDPRNHTMNPLAAPPRSEADNNHSPFGPPIAMSKGIKSKTEEPYVAWGKPPEGGFSNLTRYELECRNSEMDGLSKKMRDTEIAMALKLIQGSEAEKSTPGERSYYTELDELKSQERSKPTREEIASKEFYSSVFATPAATTEEKSQSPTDNTFKPIGTRTAEEPWQSSESSNSVNQTIKVGGTPGISVNNSIWGNH